MTTQQQLHIPALAPGERFPTPVGDVITKRAREIQHGDKWLEAWNSGRLHVVVVESRWNNGIIETADGDTYYVHPEIMLAVLAPDQPTAEEVAPKVTPRDAIDWFNWQHERGDIDRRTKDAALKRWAQSGSRTWLTRDGWKFTIGNDAIACDCGKGIYCPLVKQTRVAQ